MTNGTIISMILNMTANKINNKPMRQLAYELFNLQLLLHVKILIIHRYSVFRVCSAVLQRYSLAKCCILKM